MSDSQPEKTGWHLPGWVRELALKILYVVVPLLIVAAGSLYIDVNNMKKDMSREIWRNDKQDIQHDRTNEEVAELKDTQNVFSSEALKRLDELLELERARRKR